MFVCVCARAYLGADIEVSAKYNDFSYFFVIIFITSLFTRQMISVGNLCDRDSVQSNREFYQPPHPKKMVPKMF